MIDPRAIVEPGARIAPDVSVGPFSIVGADVEIGEGTTIASHVVITGHTRIGRNNRIQQFCSIGEAPQHSGYRGEPTRLEIGDDNVIREFCTLNRGTPVGRGVTTIGNRNFLMAYVHVAHDCEIGDNTIFANCASIAGHVQVGDYAVLGGFTLVHQFCRVGAHCITGIGAVCLQDVPPYVVAAGNTAAPHGINVKGLRRRGFSDEAIAELRRAYRLVYRSRLPLNVALDTLVADTERTPEVAAFAEFLGSSQRGVIR